LPNSDHSCRSAALEQDRLCGAPAQPVVDVLAIAQVPPLVPIQGTALADILLDRGNWSGGR